MTAIIETDIANKFTEERAVTSETQRVQWGALWVLQAIASTAVRAGNISKTDLYDEKKMMAVLNGHLNRIDETLPELAASTNLVSDVFGYMHHQIKRVSHETNTPSVGHKKISEDFMLGWFSDVVEETLQAKESLLQADIVMIVGNQGAGKSLAVNFFEEQGYAVVSMSKIVREVVSSWGLQETGTIDKIVGGQVFKDYFGKDILVHLGVENLSANGQIKILIDGPKVIEEAQAVVNMGGKLIGVVTDLNPEVDKEERKARVSHRALVDQSRQSDVKKFESREQIEYPRISEILSLIDPTNILINKDAESFKENLKHSFS